MKIKTRLKIATAFVAIPVSFFSLNAFADQVFSDDVIINGGSLCVGFDCVNGESFGFDTIRMKENNTRLHFMDTSTSASFPTADWRIVANDSSNGGASYLAFEDTDAGRQTFKVEQGARVNNLLVESDGDVGIKQGNPVVDLHITEGNTPTVRLDQDGSQGFTPQVWDVAGNEANFFIRDVTNGSLLSFKIKPGAPENSLFVAADGDIGLGTAAPAQALHVRGTDNQTVFVENTQTTSTGVKPMLWASNNGGAQLVLQDRNEGNTWKATGARKFIISDQNTVQKFTLDTNGNVDITGDLTTGGAGACNAGCDAVFEADYDLPTIEEHAEAMWSNGYLPTVGPTTPDQPFNVTQKVGRMLNELEKAHIYIADINEQNKVLAQENEALKARLDAIEAKLQ